MFSLICLSTHWFLVQTGFCWPQDCQFLSFFFILKSLFASLCCPTYPLSGVMWSADRISGWADGNRFTFFNLLTLWPVNRELFTGTILKPVQQPIKEDRIFLNVLVWHPGRRSSIQAAELCFGSRLETASSCFGASAWPCVCQTMPPLNAANPTTEGCSGSCPGEPPRTCTATETSQNCPPSRKADGMRARGESPMNPWRQSTWVLSRTLAAQANQKGGLLVSVSVWCSHVTPLNWPDGKSQTQDSRGILDYKKVPDTPPTPHLSSVQFQFVHDKSLFSQLDEQEVTFSLLRRVCLVCSNTWCHNTSCQLSPSGPGVCQCLLCVTGYGWHRHFSDITHSHTFT